MAKQITIEKECLCGWTGYVLNETMKKKVKDNLLTYYFEYSCPKCGRAIKP